MLRQNMVQCLRDGSRHWSSTRSLRSVFILLDSQPQCEVGGRSSPTMPVRKLRPREMRY